MRKMFPVSEFSGETLANRRRLCYTDFTNKQKGDRDMDSLTALVKSFSEIIEKLVDFFRDFVAQMRGIGDNN